MYEQFEWRKIDWNSFEYCTKIWFFRIFTMISTRLSLSQLLKIGCFVSFRRISIDNFDVLRLYAVANDTEVITLNRHSPPSLNPIDWLDVTSFRCLLWIARYSELNWCNCFSVFLNFDSQMTMTAVLLAQHWHFYVPLSTDVKEKWRPVKSMCWIATASLVY